MKKLILGLMMSMSPIMLSGAARAPGAPILDAFITTNNARVRQVGVHVYQEMILGDNIELLRLLIENPCFNVNFCVHGDLSLLMCFAMYLRDKGLWDSVLRGPNVNIHARDAKDNSVLMYAVRAGNTLAIDKLGMRGACLLPRDLSRLTEEIANTGTRKNKTPLQHGLDYYMQCVGSSA